MSFFGKLVDQFTQLGTLSRATPEQLVEVLLPGWIVPNSNTRKALEVSRHTDRLLMQMPPASIKRALISGMRSADPYVRDACGHRLSNFVDDDVATVMLNALGDDNSWVRTHAVSFFAYSANPTHLLHHEEIVRGLHVAMEREADEKRKALLREAAERFTATKTAGAVATAEPVGSRPPKISYELSRGWRTLPESMGKTLTVEHVSGQARITFSAGPCGRSEDQQRDFRAQAVSDYLRKGVLPGGSYGRAPASKVLFIRTDLPLAGEANAVRASYVNLDGDLAGFISLFHEGLEHTIQWTTRPALEKEVEEIVESFRFG